MTKDSDLNLRLNELEKLLSYEFKDRSVLIEALTHRSYSHEKKVKRNYERLEFLGDAVLQLIITEYLLDKYKDYDEGVLSKLRGHFVSEGFLSELATSMCIGEYIFLGKGEMASGGRNKDSLLCDIFESIVAAVYIDGGYETAEKTVIELFGGRMDEDISNNTFIDAKSELQKITQKVLGMLPEYNVIREQGPEHDKTFVVELTVGDAICETGEGKSKKSAEKDAAVKALKKFPDEA
ncbi:ribonuclease III [Limisalsivibrio acetivorans]|uniref:ribonuclease III n=1 Tax=Limisalsivibrio acetivorans TaxID=1304888 RepID=UPI0003B59361|nr:ribonuclease III [Limisalsivibrio acetivorans]